MRFVLVLLIYLFFTQSSGEDICSKQNYLKNIVCNIESIDYKYESFHDLSAIGDYIGDSRIVMVGEHKHTDSTSAEAKLRLINYLYFQKDFDVLIIESSMYGVEKKIKKINSGIPALQANYMVSQYPFLWESDFTFWDYISNNLKTKKPLIIEGFDVANSKEFVFDLEQIIKSFDEKYIQSDDWKKYKSLYLNMYSLDKNNAKDLMGIYISNANNVITHLTKISKLNKNNLEFERWIQHIKNDIGTREWQMFSDDKLRNKNEFEYNRLRDRQIADNLIWFIDEYYPEKKIIISASTYHISRNIDKIDSKSKIITESKPMGEYLWEKYKESIYSIAFIEYSGKTAMGFEKNKDVAKKKSCSIEGVLNALPYDYSFLDLKTESQKDKGNWLGDEFMMSPTFRESNLMGKWSQIYDGLFFSKVIAPNNYRRIPDKFMKN